APGATPSGVTPSSMASAMAALREPPAADFSFIYETGQREMDDKGIPETSAWAAKYGCGPRRSAAEIVDTQPGYVYDSTQAESAESGLGTAAGGREGSGLRLSGLQERQGDSRRRARRQGPHRRPRAKGHRGTGEVDGVGEGWQAAAGALRHTGSIRLAQPLT